MISCILTQISRNSQGLPVRKESAIAGESIRIGRSAACKIHLQDHRVSLHHATIKRLEDGTLYIEGEKNAAIGINGSIEQNVALSPGMRVEIGPYLFIVEPTPDGYDIALSVEMTQPLPEQDVAKIGQTAPVTLAALGLSKRKIGLGLAAFIFFAFLLLPMLPSVSSGLDKWQAALPITLNESWSPEPLAGGHSVFGSKCSTCHQRPFQAVPDEACVGCHKQIAKHLAKDDLHASVFKSMRCTSCHLDHQGREGLVLHNSSGCVVCHGDIKRKNASTKMGNVHDFGSDHPPFRIALLDGKDISRIRQGKNVKLVEKPRLKYSHQVHLDKKGVSSPLGRTVMVCGDCHKADEAGHFAPMTMRGTCQQSRCHELYFAEPVEGVVPHGSEREVMDKLRGFYTKWLAESADRNREECAQTGGSGNVAMRTLECASELAHKNAAATLFKQDGEDIECAVCHEIEETGVKDVPWKVASLQINRDWQPGAVFAHAKHGTIGCTECHDKANSKNSGDVAMPTIEKCRECHAGNRPVKGKVRSACGSCHQFHRSAK